MHRIQQKKSKNMVIISTVLMIILIGCVVFLSFSILNHNSNSVKQNDQNKPSDVNYDTPTSDQIKDGSDTKKSNIDNYNNPTGPSSTHQMTITSSAVNAEVFQVRVLIEGVHSGTCTITLNNNGQTVTKVVDIQSLASSTTCQGFNIPTSELSAGKWDYTIFATFSDGSTSSTQGTIDV